MNQRLFALGRGSGAVLFRFGSQGSVSDDLHPFHRRGRAIILDTKFYSQALKGGDHGSAKLIPSNLYQLFTYLRQRASISGWEQAEGVLLYPQTTRRFSAEFTTHGHRIRALTLDLTQQWQEIRDRLLQIVRTAGAK